MPQAPDLNYKFSKDASPGPGLSLLHLEHLQPEGEAGGGEDGDLLPKPPGQPSHPAPAVPDAARGAEVDQ